MFANTMASRDNFEDLNLEPDEIKRITEALKDEQFRKLFVEYAEEIADPENRRRYEEEISQMENERGMDVQFIHPKPGHVLKTTVNGNKIAYINICQNDKIEKPSFEQKHGSDNRNGMFWQIPHSFAPEREDFDKGEANCMVYDFVINPDTYRMSESNDRYQKMLYDIAFDGIEEKFNAKLDRKNFKRIKLEFKGIPQATVIRTRRSVDPPTEKESPKDDLLKDMPYPYDNKTTAEKTHELELQAKKRRDEKQKKESKGKRVKDKENKDATTPKYTITHRSELDLQEYCHKPEARPSTRPKALVVKIDLPLLSSAEPVNLDIFEQRLVLESVKPATYKLDIRLPYPVNDDEGSAKFDKAKHCLVVTLPVIPDEVPKLTSFIEDENVQNEDVPDKSNNQSSCPEKPLIEELHDLSLSPPKNDVNLNDNATHPSKKSEKEIQVVYSLPSYEFSQDNETVSFVFNVKRITSETVTKSFPSQDSVTLKFVSVGSGYFPMHYSIHIKFGHGCEIVADQCSVETSEQNAVLLLLKARHCRGIWEQFEVGVDADHLESKLFLTEGNLQQQLEALDKEADQLEKLEHTEDSQPQVQVTEMNERKLTIQIKSAGIPEDADNDEYDPPSSADIQVIQDNTGPKLQSILKQRTLSESSDDFGVNPEIPRPVQEEELALSLNGRFRKSVSFNNHIDKTTYKPTASPTSMKAALKSKRRRARKKDEKISKKAGRRRHNSGGSEGSSGDDLSSDSHSLSEESEEKNAEFEQIDEEVAMAAVGLEEADVLLKKDYQDFRTSVCVEDANSNDEKKEKENEVIKVVERNGFTPDIKMASDSDDDNQDDDDDDDFNDRTSESVSKIESGAGELVNCDGDKKLDNESSKERSAPVIDAQIISSEDLSSPGSLKRLVEEDGSSFVRINADYHSRTEQQKCDNMKSCQKQTGENNNEDPADDGVQSELSWNESKVNGCDNEHRTQCAFSFSNSLIFDLDVD